MSKSPYSVMPVGTLWSVIDPDGKSLVTLPVKYKAEDIAAMLKTAYCRGAAAALGQTRRLIADPSLSVPEMLAALGLPR